MPLSTKVKILAITSNPDDSSNIRSDRIFRAIKKGIQKAEKSDHFEIEIEPAASLDSFSIAIEKYKPDILHLIGHGSKLSPFVFESPSGGREYSEAEIIANQIKQYANNIKGVIITACDSYILAKKISEKIYFSFGKDGNLNKDIAATFTQWLYYYLAEENSIDQASKKTALKLANHSISKKQLPELASDLTEEFFILETSKYFSLSDKLAHGSERYCRQLVEQTEYQQYHKGNISYSTADILTQVNESSSETFEDCLSRSWGNNRSSVLLKSSAKGGKTFACFCLWHKYITDKNAPTILYIPCRELEKLYEEESNSKLLISSFIIKFYLQKRAISPKIRENLEEEFKMQPESNDPRYLIILDGYGQLNKSKDTVIKALNEFWCTEAAEGVQVILTTRLEMHDLDQFQRMISSSLILRETNEEAKWHDVSITEKSIAKIPKIFILTSTKEQIRLTLNKTNFRKIYPNRYHSTALEFWRPFQLRPGEDKANEYTIEELLIQFRNRTGFQFNYYFSNGQLMDEDEYFNLIKTLPRTIGIIDLLAIAEENSELVKKFDTINVGGVVLPICTELKKPLRKIVERNSRIFTYLKLGINREDFFYDFFAPNSSSYINFYNDLRNIFKNNFPNKTKKIKDSNSEDDNLRYMKF